MFTCILLIGCGEKEQMTKEATSSSEVVVEQNHEVETESKGEFLPTESTIDVLAETESAEDKGSSQQEEEKPMIEESTAETTPEPIVETTSVPIPESTPEPIVTTTPVPVQTPEPEEEEEEEELTTPQRNSVNMMNYITVLTQEINNSKNSRIYLDSVQSSLLNNMNLNAIDNKTQGQINSLWRTITVIK